MAVFYSEGADDRQAVGRFEPLQSHELHPVDQNMMTTGYHTAAASSTEIQGFDKESKTLHYSAWSCCSYCLALAGSPAFFAACVASEIPLRRLGVRCRDASSSLSAAAG